MIVHRLGDWMHGGVVEVEGRLGVVSQRRGSLLFP